MYVSMSANAAVIAAEEPALASAVLSSRILATTYSAASAAAFAFSAEIRISALISAVVQVESLQIVAPPTPVKAAAAEAVARLVAAFVAAVLAAVSAAFALVTAAAAAFTVRLPDTAAAAAVTALAALLPTTAACVTAAVVWVLAVDAFDVAELLEPPPPAAAANARTANAVVPALTVPTAAACAPEAPAALVVVCACAYGANAIVNAAIAASVLFLFMSRFPSELWGLSGADAKERKLYHLHVTFEVGYMLAYSQDVINFILIKNHTLCITRGKPLSETPLDTDAQLDGVVLGFHPACHAVGGPNAPVRERWADRPGRELSDHLQAQAAAVALVQADIL
jgi:hypothetical protein